MAKAKKSKWILGLTGTALSAFVISQVGANLPNGGTAADKVLMKSVGGQEKELMQLDWSNFEINGAIALEGAGQSDRQTRRS